MATTPILLDRRPATARRIVDHHEVIPVDDHPGYFYVTDTATVPGQTYIATSLDCNCADYTTGCCPCQHMAVVKREALALLSYAADWDRRAVQQRPCLYCSTTRGAAGRRRRSGRRGVGGRRWHSVSTTRNSKLPLQEPPSVDAGNDQEAMDAALEREELEGAAQDLLGLLVLTKHDRMLEAAAPIPWKLGMALITDRDDELRRLGLTLALDAVLERPDLLVAAVRVLHTRLVAVAPRLVLRARKTQEAGDDQHSR
jgi:hypothetical protein